MLRCSENESLAEDEQTSRFIFQNDGKLVLTDEDDEEVGVGAFNAKYLNVTSAMTEAESVFDVFDSNSTYIQYFAALLHADAVARARAGK